MTSYSKISLISIPIVWFLCLALFKWPVEVTRFTGPNGIHLSVYARPNYTNPLYYMSLGLLSTYENTFIYAELKDNNSKLIGVAILAEAGDVIQDHDNPKVIWQDCSVKIIEEATKNELYIPFTH